MTIGTGGALQMAREDHAFAVGMMTALVMLAAPDKGAARLAREIAEARMQSALRVMRTQGDGR
jgi:hypothetical protein